MRVIILLALSAITVVGATPSRLVAVSAHDGAALRLAAAAGARTWGATDSWQLLDAFPAVTGREITLDPLLPVWFTWPGGDIALPRAPLLADGVVLIQLDNAEAARLRAAGWRLIRMRAEPVPLRVQRAAVVPRIADTDTFVQRLVNEVSPDSIRARMAELCAFRTRYSATDSCRRAEEHVFDYFTRLGLDSVELDSYPRGGGTYWRNPVGILPGRSRPDKELIICGHMDAISEDPENLAPGAEDNASGAAMALEAARILCDENLDLTVKFINFTGEEEGLFGSQHYAQRMRAAGADILGAFNYDMVSWPGGAWGVALVGLAPARRLCEYQAAMADAYTPLDHRISVRSFPSDSRSFDEAGYPATSGYEYGPNGYIWYHTTGDTLGNCDFELAADVCRMAVATLASIAVAPLPPEGLVLADCGNGTTLRASWRANPEPDIAGYRVFWGTDTFTYTDSLDAGADTTALITGLEPDQRYFATVLARDADGYESGFADEASAVPAVAPAAPEGLSALPLRWGMRIGWRPNRELDLAGYNVYRTTVAGSLYTRLNTALVTDTTWRDSGLHADTMYYYAPAAVDTAGNEGARAADARGKAITLDHGILLVDETRNGTGARGNPSDEQQDAFYHGLLAGYRYRDWDVTLDGVPLAGDFGPFSTVAWHSDEYQQRRLEASVPGLANYLSQGGRLWLTGWQPTASLAGGSPRYPYDFVPGEFPHDEAHLVRAELSTLADFTGGDGLGGYPDVRVDTAKLIPQLEGRLANIEALLPRDAEPVLAFVSFSGDTFAGKPVATRWTGGPGRAVMLGFPLYYCRDADARALARRVLDDLGEPYGIAEERAEAVGARLDVSPSPARGRLEVRYSLAAAQSARLAVYDATGRLARVLAQGPHAVGEHIARWDGRDAAGRELPAGVLFCRLEAGDGTSTRRFEFVR